MSDKKLKTYSPLEETLNIITHGAGILLGVIASWYMVSKAYREPGWVADLSVVIFGASLVLLYTASTLYHSARKKVLRYRLNILDHSSIFVLIAGTYTPFSLVTLKGTWGTVILILVWTLAIAGVVLKLWFTGRYRRLSTITYIVMGWIAVIAIGPLTSRLSLDGLYLLFGGGLSYTVGAVIFSIKKIPLNHAIFHLFVLGGSVCHILCIYFFVL